MKKYLLLLLTLFIVPSLSVEADTISGIEEDYESTSLVITYDEQYEFYIDVLNNNIPIF